MQSHRYENDFLFSCKFNSFLQERFCTEARLEGDEFLELRNGLSAKLTTDIRGLKAPFL